MPGLIDAERGKVDDRLQKTARPAEVRGASAPCGGSEKPPLRAVIGLQSPCPERKSQKTAPLTMNMNPNGRSRLKLEIPNKKRHN